MARGASPFLFTARRGVASGATPPLGVPFQVQTLGTLWPNARLIIEAAFGADITTDSAGWNWYDITTYVRFAAALTITRGRGDESSQAQPASATIELDNTSGNFTAWSVNSIYWPNIGPNTPLRVRIDLSGDGDVSSVRMFGYALGWVPTWDVSGNLPVVTVTFKGILQRLGQGKSKARSAIRRFIDVWPLAPVAYWSCEDPSTSPAPSSALPSGSPMQVTVGATSNAFPKFAAATSRIQPASTGFEILQIATDPLISLGDGGGLVGQIPAQTGATAIWNATFVGFAWAPDGGSDITLVRIDTPGGSFIRFEVILLAAGGVPALYGWTNDTVPVKTLLITGSLAFPDVVNYRLRFIDNGDGTMTVGMRVGRATSTSEFGFNINTTVSGLNAWPTTIYANPYNQTVNKTGVIGSTNQTNDIIIGHLAVYKSTLSLGAPTLQNSGFYPDGVTLRSAWGGWVGEPADDRLRRLCAEDNIPLDVTGVSTARMGIQLTNTILTLLREIETTDLGVLLDGYTRGLSYICGNARYNEATSLTADLGVDPPQLAPPLLPVDNDQRRRNSWKVTRTAGGEALAEQDTGILGVNAIGEYADSKTVNTWDTTTLADIAWWLVHLGVVEGYRYPQLNLDLVAQPVLAQAWIAMAILGRIDVTNITARAPQHPPGTVSQILEGYTETIDPVATWDVAGNCSPYHPYRVIQLAADTGDTSEYLGRLDTDDTTLTVDVPAGASSFSVTVNSGPLWTTTADDFPLSVNVAGYQITVTSITGTGPQTFTVDPSTVTRGFGAHTPVNVWDPVVLAL